MNKLFSRTSVFALIFSIVLSPQTQMFANVFPTSQTAIQSIPTNQAIVEHLMFFNVMGKEFSRFLHQRPKKVVRVSPRSAFRLTWRIVPALLFMTAPANAATHFYWTVTARPIQTIATLFLSSVLGNFVMDILRALVNKNETPPKSIVKNDPRPKAGEGASRVSEITTRSSLQVPVAVANTIPPVLSFFPREGTRYRNLVSIVDDVIENKGSNKLPMGVKSLLRNFQSGIISGLYPVGIPVSVQQEVEIELQKPIPGQTSGYQGLSANEILGKVRTLTENEIVVDAVRIFYSRYAAALREKGILLESSILEEDAIQSLRDYANEEIKRGETFNSQKLFYILGKLPSREGAFLLGLIDVAHVGQDIRENVFEFLLARSIKQSELEHNAQKGIPVDWNEFHSIVPETYFQEDLLKRIPSSRLMKTFSVQLLRESIQWDILLNNINQSRDLVKSTALIEHIRQLMREALIRDQIRPELNLLPVEMRQQIEQYLNQEPMPLGSRGITPEMLQAIEFDRLLELLPASLVLDQLPGELRQELDVDLLRRMREFALEVGTFLYLEQDVWSRDRTWIYALEAPLDEIERSYIVPIRTPPPTMLSAS